jgi:hypothetical protein
MIKLCNLHLVGVNLKFTWAEAHLHANDCRPSGPPALVGLVRAVPHLLPRRPPLQPPLEGESSQRRPGPLPWLCAWASSSTRFSSPPPRLPPEPSPYLPLASLVLRPSPPATTLPPLQHHHAFVPAARSSPRAPCRRRGPLGTPTLRSSPPPRRPSHSPHDSARCPSR